MAQVWHFTEASGRAQTVPEAEVGVFSSDKAYVVLAPPADGSEGQQRLYLWAGDSAPKDIKSTAAKHASELMQTMEASYLRQQQGQEAAEFKELFASFAVVEPPLVADPSTEAVPAQVGAEVAPAGGAEEEAEGEEDGGAAGGKKKKKKNKKKGGSQQAEAVTAEAEGAQPEAAAQVAAAVAEAPAEEAAPAVASPAKPSSDAKAPPAKASPAAAKADAASSPAPAAAEVGEAPAAEAAPAKPDSPKLSVEAPAGSASVAKVKQQLAGKLSGSLTDPLGEKQQAKKGATANGKPSATYQADAAKAWSGVGSGPAPAAPAPAPAPPAEVKVKPGEKTFMYEELKDMRVESGIDMTSKEAYLSDADFEKVFGKDRAAFKAQPAWRQQLAKKDTGLF